MMMQKATPQAVLLTSALGLPSEVRAAPTRPDPLAAIARAARDGDPTAQRSLCEALVPVMAAPLQMMFGAGHPDIEDLLQDALVGVVQGLSSFRFESSVAHFAWRVATKRAIDALRRSQTEARTREKVTHLDHPMPPTPREELTAERR